jgi:uncharacterized protein YgbK (DUF1537 family)
VSAAEPVAEAPLPERAAHPVRSLAELRAGRPAPLVLPQARERIREMNAAAGRHVVVLDDDPTGSQVVHDVPVLTGWDDDDLRWAFAHPSRTVFVLTNTRSLGAAAARALLLDLAARVHRVAAEVGTEVVLLSRSDSTLRGHFPLETDVLQQVAADRGRPCDAVLLVPAYLDAGRVTVDAVHYARDGEQYVPVAQTDYATDDAFGYRSSDLTDWVREKVGERPVQVRSLTLDDLRAGVEHVTDQLLQARDGAVVVVDALDESDLDVLALALGAAEATGWQAICRVGPSFVPARAGIDRRPPLRADEIVEGGHRAGRGLVVVGSHVELTTRQVTTLLELPGLQTVELDVTALTDDGTAAAEVDRCAAALAEAATRGDVLLMTSRQRVVLGTGESSLELARRVSAALVELTRRAVAGVELAWVVAKGGITSHDVATDGLQVRRALVLGQLFEGIVSVWRNESGAADEALVGLPYVVFAGNVGDETTLRDAVLALRGGSRA